LNFFFFRPDLNLAATIRALKQKNVLQILAEPNLIALNGKEASFLAGGEIPVPIVQGGSNQAVSVQYKEFGVRLSFIPVIMPNGNIHLTVKPEVSSLDFANGVTLSGFVIPALTTRRASTELEMRDGQSFVIAGLLDNRVSHELSKIPILGDIPILGNLFRSKNLRKNNNELMVLVTARRVAPSDQQPPLPKMPEKPLVPEEFDRPGSGGSK
jgi:pilus assembly protein CpaC